MALHPVTPSDVDDLRGFLDEMDLTLAGLDDPTVRLWIERELGGTIVGSTGYEASPDGEDVLIRSVAVAPTHRSAGAGTRLATLQFRPPLVREPDVRGCSLAARGRSGRASGFVPQIEVISRRS